MVALMAFAARLAILEPQRNLGIGPFAASGRDVVIFLIVGA